MRQHPCDPISYCVFMQVAKEPDPKYNGVNMARIEVVPPDGMDGKINLVDEAKTPAYSCCSGWS